MPAINNRGRGRRTISEPNMVPFIDVMLVLLIIFMVTAPLITPSVVDLPSVGKASKQADAVVQVVVGKNDQLELKSAEQTKPVTLDTLAGAVRKAQNQGDGQAAADTAVVISADKTVQYERVVKVMDTLQRAGIARIGLSVQLAD
jgi:biopolymer transport protein TolR